MLHTDTPGAGAVRLECECGESSKPETSAEDASGNYHFPFVSPTKNGGTYTFTADLVARPDPLLTFKLGVEPRPTAIQSPGWKGGLAAPGCSVCVIRDPHGDNRGGSPDIASASSAHVGGWVTFKIVTFGPVRSGFPPCVTGWIVRGRRNASFNVCTLPRFARLRARVSYPNARTIVYRVRASAFRSAKQVLWQVWVLYPGDTLKDTVPNVVHLGNDPRNCFVVAQLRPGSPGDYVFGTTPCSQRTVVTAKP